MCNVCDFLIMSDAEWAEHASKCVTSLATLQSHWTTVPFLEHLGNVRYYPSVKTKPQSKRGSRHWDLYKAVGYCPALLDLKPTRQMLAATFLRCFQDVNMLATFSVMQHDGFIKMAIYYSGHDVEGDFTRATGLVVTRKSINRTFRWELPANYTHSWNDPKCHHCATLINTCILSHTYYCQILRRSRTKCNVCANCNVGAVSCLKDIQRWTLNIPIRVAAFCFTPTWHRLTAASTTLPNSTSLVPNASICEL